MNCCPCPQPSLGMARGHVDSNARTDCIWLNARVRRDDHECCGVSHGVGQERQESLHVLIVTQYFWPEDFRINDLALGLRDRGHTVSILTGKPNYPAGEFFDGYGFLKKAKESYQGMEVRRVPLITRGRGGGIRLAANYLSFAVFASALAPLMCRGSYDVIIVFEPSPITVGFPARVLRAITRAPVLFWVQDLWPETVQAMGAIRSPAVLKCMQSLSRFVYRGCDRILVQSRAFMEPIRKLGIASERIRYFPNTAEAVYEPVVLPANAAELALLPEGFRVMFAGNIGAAQDFGTIIEAAERLRARTDIHWVVLGGGRLETWVREQVRARGLTDTFHLLGRYPVARMPRFFAAADVLLVTLKREPVLALTIPSKLQSYLACGRPVVATLEGEGARVVRESGAGIVVEPEDAQGLADAVLSLASMPETEREALGAAGRRYFEKHFERERLLKQLEEWMIELAGSSSPATN